MIDTSSMYEIVSTMMALKDRRNPPKGLTPDEAAATRNRLAELFKNDPNVRLH